MNLNNLAKLLYTQGNYAAAEPLCRRALAIDEKALGPNHPTVAWYLNNRALLFKAKGDYAAAEPLCRRALAIDDKALGPDHPTTRQIKKNLATFSRNPPKPPRQNLRTDRTSISIAASYPRSRLISSRHPH